MREVGDELARDVRQAGAFEQFIGGALRGVRRPGPAEAVAAVGHAAHGEEEVVARVGAGVDALLNVVVALVADRLRSEFDRMKPGIGCDDGFAKLIHRLNQVQFGLS